MAARVVRAAVLVCEDEEVWSDLGPLWARALFGGGEGETEDGADGAEEVLVRHHASPEPAATSAAARQEVVFFNAVQRELPRKDLLFRSGENGGIDLVVITGSRHSVNDPDQAEWLAPLEGLVRLVVRDRPGGFDESTLVRPRVIAGCFGCQVVAKALGGQVAKNPSGRFVFGAEEIRPSPALGLMEWAPLAPEPMRILESHGECVQVLPPGSVHLASSETCTNEMFYVPVLAPSAEADAPGGILALQSHPEFQIEHMLDRILPSIETGGLVDAREAADGIASMDAGPLDDDRMLSILRAFAWGQKCPSEESLRDRDPVEIAAMVDRLREAFRIESRRLTSAYEIALAGYRVKDPSTAAGGADASYATYAVASDRSDVARAEALLRGEASLPDLLRGDFPQGNGDRATMIDSAKAAASRPFTDADRDRLTFKGMHSMNILCASAAWVPALDRPILFSGAADKLLSATDPTTGRMPFGPFRCTAPVVGVKFRPTAPGSAIPPVALVICMDGKVSLLRAKAQIDVPGDSAAFSLSEPGLEPLPGSDQLKAHGKMATALAWSADGQWFASAGRDHAVNVYQLQKCQSEEDAGVKHSRTLQCADCPDALAFIECFGSLCLVVAVRGEYRLQYLCVARRDEEATLPVGSVLKVNMNAKGDDFVSFAVLDMAAAPGGLPVLAVATDKSRVILFKAGSTHQMRNLYGHTCSEFSRSRIAWHPSGRYLVSNSENPLGIVVWDVATGEKIQELQGHTQSIRDVAILGPECGSYANHLASCSFDRSVQLFAPSPGTASDA